MKKKENELLFIFIHECSHAITPHRERKVKNKFIRIDHSREFYENFLKLLNIAYNNKLINQKFNNIEELMKKDKRKENADRQRRGLIAPPLLPVTRGASHTRSAASRGAASRSAAAVLARAREEAAAAAEPDRALDFAECALQWVDTLRSLCARSVRAVTGTGGTCPSLFVLSYSVSARCAADTRIRCTCGTIGVLCP